MTNSKNHLTKIGATVLPILIFLASLPGMAQNSRGPWFWKEGLYTFLPEWKNGYGSLPQDPDPILQISSDSTGVTVRSLEVVSLTNAGIVILWLDDCPGSDASFKRLKTDVVEVTLDCLGEGRTKLELPKPYPKKVSIKAQVGGEFKLNNTFILEEGASVIDGDRLSGALVGSTSYLYRYYTHISQQMSKLKSNMSRSDHNFLQRLFNLIEQGRALMVDKDGKPKIAITDTRIMENARVVMVVSSVLDYLMENYGDTDWMKQSLLAQDLPKLPQTIRRIYGWDQGMAGQGSKVYQALGEVLTQEMGNLYFLLSETNDLRANTVIELAKMARTLTVKATVTSDTATLNEVDQFIRAWEQPETQRLFRELLEAKSKGPLQTRLEVILTTVASLGAYSQKNIQLPGPTTANK